MGPSWRNPKHRAQWEMTLTVYAKPLRSMARDMIEVKPLARSWQFWPPIGERLRGKSAGLNETSLLVSPRSKVARAGTALRVQGMRLGFGAPIYSRARIEKLAPNQGSDG